jgi:hypothetical protein
MVEAGPNSWCRMAYRWGYGGSGGVESCGVVVEGFVDRDGGSWGGGEGGGVGCKGGGGGVGKSSGSGVVGGDGGEGGRGGVECEGGVRRT